MLNVQCNNKLNIQNIDFLACYSIEILHKVSLQGFFHLFISICNMNHIKVKNIVESANIEALKKVVLIFLLLSSCFYMLSVNYHCYHLLFTNRGKYHIKLTKLFNMIREQTRQNLLTSIYY